MRTPPAPTRPATPPRPLPAPPRADSRAPRQETVEAYLARLGYTLDDLADWLLRA